MSDFGRKMQELRRQKRLTQKEVGYCCGISAQAISRYENGSAEPDIAMMKKIAALLSTDVNTLIGYKHNRNVFTMSRNEIELVQSFRKSTQVVRRSVLILLEKSNQNKE